MSKEEHFISEYRILGQGSFFLHGEVRKEINDQMKEAFNWGGLGREQNKTKNQIKLKKPLTILY